MQYKQLVVFKDKKQEKNIHPSSKQHVTVFWK